MTRPSWDDYFKQIAKDVASRSSCPRASCGVVIVKDNRILSTGYNGAPSGLPDCLEVGCDIVDNHCIRAAHGEQNAIGYAAKYGIPLDGAECYIYFKSYGSKWTGPCDYCYLLLQVSGIALVHTDIDYA